MIEFSFTAKEIIVIMLVWAFGVPLASMLAEMTVEAIRGHRTEEGEEDV